MKTRSTVDVVSGKGVFAELMYVLRMANGGRLMLPVVYKFEQNGRPEYSTEVQEERLHYEDKDGRENINLTDELRKIVERAIRAEGPAAARQHGVLDRAKLRR